jgi:hypothetical protein
MPPAHHLPVSAPAARAQSQDILFDSFDSYASGSGLAGQGGWIGRFGGGITASQEQWVSPPQSCRMDNDNGCWASQLYHPLPYLDVLWFSFNGP